MLRRWDASWSSQLTMSLSWSLEGARLLCGLSRRTAATAAPTQPNEVRRRLIDKFSNKTISVGVSPHRAATMPMSTGMQPNTKSTTSTSSSSSDEVDGSEISPSCAALAEFVQQVFCLDSRTFVVRQSADPIGAAGNALEDLHEFLVAVQRRVGMIMMQKKASGSLVPCKAIEAADWYQFFERTLQHSAWQSSVTDATNNVSALSRDTALTMLRLASVLNAIQTLCRVAHHNAASSLTGSDADGHMRKRTEALFDALVWRPVCWILRHIHLSDDDARPGHGKSDQSSTTYPLTQVGQALCSSWSQIRGRLSIAERVCATAMLQAVMSEAPAHYRTCCGLPGSTTFPFCDLLISLRNIAALHELLQQRASSSSSTSRSNDDIGGELSTSEPRCQLSDVEIVHRSPHSQFNLSLHALNNYRRLLMKKNPHALDENTISLEGRAESATTVLRLPSQTALLLPVDVLRELVDAVRRDIVDGCLLSTLGDDKDVGGARPPPIVNRKLIQFSLDVESDVSRLLHFHEINDWCCANRDGDGHPPPPAGSGFYFDNVHPMPPSADQEMRKHFSVSAAATQWAADDAAASASLFVSSFATDLHQLGERLVALRRSVSDAVLQETLALGRASIGSGATEDTDHASASAFLFHTRRSFASLGKRHFSESQGSAVLTAWVQASLVVFASASHDDVVRWSRHPAKAIQLCPGGLPLAHALELLYFAALMVADGNEQHSGLVAVDWANAARRLLRVVIDGLLFNETQYLRSWNHMRQEQSLFRNCRSASDDLDVSNGKSPTGVPQPKLTLLELSQLLMVTSHDVRSMFAMAAPQARRPCIALMPVWQLHELMMTVHVLCGSPLGHGGDNTQQTTRAVFIPLRSHAPLSNERAQNEAAARRVAQFQKRIAHRVKQLRKLGLAMDESSERMPAPYQRDDSMSVGADRLSLDAAERAHARNWMVAGERGFHLHAAHLSRTPQHDVGFASDSALFERALKRIRCMSSYAAVHQFDKPADCSGSESAEMDPSSGSGSDANSLQNSSTSDRPANDAALIDDEWEVVTAPQIAQGSPGMPVGDKAMDSSASDSVLCVTVHRAPGGSLGFSVDRRRYILDMELGGPLQKSCAAIGMFASDIKGMQVVALNDAPVTSVEELIAAMRSSRRDAADVVTLTLQQPSLDSSEGTSQEAHKEEEKDGSMPQYSRHLPRHTSSSYESIPRRAVRASQFLSASDHDDSE